MIIKDRVYGEEEITEQVLIDLINSVPVQRLKEVSQFGMPEEYYHLPSFSRFEHSIGVMILLRRLGAGLEEQIAGLLHDVSHTAFSHVIDWVLGDSTKEDYQDKTLLKTFEETGIKNILETYGFNCKKIAAIENYSLLEQSIPHLCADRVDYSLREIKFLHSERDAEKILKNLKNINGKMVLASVETARLLARYYNNLNKEHWAGDQAKTRYHILANVLKKAIKEKIISIEDLMKTDKELMKLLNKSNHEEIVSGLNLLKNGFYLKKTDKKGISLQKKFRYLDPEVFHNGKIISLSEFSEEYKKILEEEKKHFLIKEEFLIIPKK
jgi:HD superfamily phosphohydrolase